MAVFGMFALRECAALLSVRFLFLARSRSISSTMSLSVRLRTVPAISVVVLLTAGVATIAVLIRFSCNRGVTFGARADLGSSWIDDLHL